MPHVDILVKNELCMIGVLLIVYHTVTVSIITLSVCSARNHLMATLCHAYVCGTHVYTNFHMCAV